MLNYGFCFTDNRYETVELNMELNLDWKIPQASKMVILTPSQLLTIQPIKLSKSRLSTTMLHYLRSTLQQSFFNYTSFTALSGRKILLTQPKLLKYELYVF
jgi:hypothetical protein